MWTRTKVGQRVFQAEGIWPEIWSAFRQKHVKCQEPRLERKVRSDLEVQVAGIELYLSSSERAVPVRHSFPCVLGKVVNLLLCYSFQGPRN